MDIVLSKRNRIVAGILLLFILLILPAYYLIRLNELPEIDNITPEIQKGINELENSIGRNVKDLKGRGAHLHQRYQVSILKHEDLLPEESIVIVKDGVIETYFGEVFFFKSVELESGNWIFIKKEGNLYFLMKLEENLYFLKKYNSIESTFGEIKKVFPFISTDIKYYERPAPGNKSRALYDENNDAFYIYYLSANSNEQLFLVIKFSTEAYLSFWKINFQKKFLIFYILISIIFALFLPVRFKFIRGICRLILIPAIFLFLSLIVDDSLFFNILGLEIRSVIQFFYIAILYFFFSTKLGSLLKKNRYSPGISLIIMIFSILISVSFINSVNFSYVNFNPEINYILFILTLFFFLNAPFKILNSTGYPPGRSAILLFIFLNGLFIVCVRSLMGILLIIPVTISISLILLFLSRKNLLVETVRIFFISIAIFMMVFSISEKEKQNFISVGLKNIFSNQNNYAKFISREIIHNIHQWNENLSDYFGENKGMELEKIWRRSIALKENISSGIYVISDEKKMLSSFSYRIPYLNVILDNKFPLWQIDEFKAEYFGKTISVAVASINVYDNYKYLGKIIVQVMNSSDLITKDHPENNIFTLNRRVGGADLSYIKLNSKMQVIENPSNIDIRNINKRTVGKESWIGFKFMDTEFIGYIFESNDDTLIIFYPRTTYSEKFSDIIKIFLLIFAVNIIITIRKLLDIEWKIFMMTFSVRVFGILILISLFSAIVFSVFSIQFNRQNREINFRRQIYNSGGVAYNILSEIIEKDKILGRDHLFFLSKILNTDVSIYQNDRLFETSNYNKIINSEIPVLISSKVPILLEESEKFVIDSTIGSSRIFFTISDYIVRMDYKGKSTDILTRSTLYSNFIINLFFILTIAGILLAFLFRRKILSPINTLNNKMSKVKIGELEEIDEIPGEIEIRNLFKGFNSMVSGIREQRKNISDISRMKTLIKLSRWIAHEVKNPLTPIKLSAEQIMLSLKDKREDYEKLITESVKYIMDETDHLRNISLGFLDISNLNKVNLSYFDLVELCGSELSKLQQVYKKTDFKFDHSDDFPTVRMDRIKIIQVLKNLLINSIESIKKKGGIISLSLGYDEKNINIVLKDNGSGIEGIDHEELFDEDFSTKSSGTGLGLFIVKRIIDLHEGSIRIESNGSGTTVEISIPKEADKFKKKDLSGQSEQEYD